ncbi:hypothetical protein [Kineosporia succinea]|uniref:Uncharacterized protein n=1 Tax=Kineosporia succinea TaxID=84632 RepID=A0ABT9PCQ3_9ACTN|nr:hypothetical protein [Kineosporia succinea]MDP9830494.1 hypothetical protein [Kineosporia succinea]
MTTRSTVMTFAGLGLVATLGLTGCSSDGDGDQGAKSPVGAKTDTPKERVVNAITQLGESTSASFALKLDSTEADLKKIQAAQPETGTDDDGITADDVESMRQILGGEVLFSTTAPAGKTLGDLTEPGALELDPMTLLKDPAKMKAALAAQASTSASVKYEGSSLFDYVNVSNMLYVRADAEKIATMSGLGDVNDAKALLGQLPPVMATPAGAVLDGKWVSLDLAETFEALNKTGALDELELPETTATPSIDPSQVQNFVASIGAALENDSTIDEIDGGDRGDGYRVDVPVQKIAKAVQDDLVSIFGEFGGKDFEKDIAKSINEIAPSEHFTVDVFVKDDKLSGVSLDLTQILQKPVSGVTFALAADIDAEADAVKGPSGATAVDITAIMNAIPADTFSGMGSAIG